MSKQGGETRDGKLYALADQIKSKGGGAGQDGFEHCNRCGRGNTVWFAPSPLWNAVMRGGSIDGAPKYNDLVCATCFMALAEEAGVASHFKVFAEQVNVELETTTPTGRVWDEDRQLWIDPPDPTAVAAQSTRPRTPNSDPVRAGLQATRGGSDQVDGVAPEDFKLLVHGEHDKAAVAVDRPRSAVATDTSEVASGGEDASKEPKTCAEDQKLRELLEWAEATANSYSVAPPGEINEWTARVFRDLVSRIQASLSSEASS